MRVSRIEIFGFKSFLERFVINFDRDLIGLIGPNGCGKSNVVDALRWVLGETYAKQLRGSGFEDLIFAGSDTRRPLGMAEVSLTIRPTEGWTELINEPIKLSEIEDTETQGETDSLAEEVKAEQGAANEEPSEVEAEKLARPGIFTEIPGLLNAAEVQLTRRLYRSGESEYFINKVPCRLRDMIELYRLMGLGARGLSIVQQGEIGQLISKKPIERRELLEEAAGIAGFRAKMEAAERKLERTAENMARLQDIIIEVEKQVRGLERQAKRARERGELKASLSDLDMDLFRSRSARIIWGRQGKQEDHTRLGQELESLLAQVASEEAQQVELQSQIETIEVQLAEKRAGRDELQRVINAEQARINEIRLQAALVGEKISGVEKSIQRWRERSARVLEEQQQSRNKQGELQGLLEHAREKRQEAEKNLLGIQERPAEEENTAENVFVLDPEVAAELEALQQEVLELPELESKLRELQLLLQGQEAELKDKAKQREKERISLATVQSEVLSINKQLEALAEHALGRAQFGAKDNSSAERGAEIKGVLLAGLVVPESLQRSVAAVLGEKGQYALSSDAFALGQVFAQSEGSEKNRKLGVLDEGYAEENTFVELSAEELSTAPSARRLLAELEVRDGYQNVVQTFLGAFVIVDSFEEALKLNQANKLAGRALRQIVTRQGELVLPWGWYTTEGKGAAYSFTRRIQEQEKSAGTIIAKLAELESALARAEEQTEETRALHREKTARREQVLKSQRRLLELRRQEQEFEKRHNEARQRAERERREQRAREERGAQEELRRASTRLVGIERELEFEAARANKLEEEKLNAERSREQLEVELTQLLEQSRDIGIKLQEGIADGSQSIEEIQRRARELEDEIRTLDRARSPLKVSHSEVLDLLTRHRRQVATLQERRNTLHLEMERSEIELGLLYEEIQKILPEQQPISEQDLEDISSICEKSYSSNVDQMIRDLNEEASKLRRRIEREGDVDPQSIELCEQEQARLSGLREQYSDLSEARTILERTIRQLKEISKARFLETFKFVSGKFTELVPRLFGGGAGHLELVNPEDPLTSGVEIFVRPPGKKISNMELLSGGEKALVAVSVLLSMFLYRPSPICVLDEVDAPLDDANVQRYLDIISEIGARTQFLVITHNKDTMARMHKLIGVTMQEKGVSKALSVAIDTPAEELERFVANA